MVTTVPECSHVSVVASCRLHFSIETSQDTKLVVVVHVLFYQIIYILVELGTTERVGLRDVVSCAKEIHAQSVQTVMLVCTMIKEQCVSPYITQVLEL